MGLIETETELAAKAGKPPCSAACWPCLHRDERPLRPALWGDHAGGGADAACALRSEGINSMTFELRYW